MTSTNTPSTSNKTTPTNQQSGTVEVKYGPSLPIAKAILHTPQMPPGFNLSYTSRSGSGFGNNESLANAKTNRFINLNRSDTSKPVLIQVSLGRYTSNRTAKNGVKQTVQQYGSSLSTAQSSSNVLGTYYALTFKENGVTNAVVVHRDGNVVQVILVVGGTNPMSVAKQLAKTQGVQLSRLSA